MDLTTMETVALQNQLYTFNKKRVVVDTAVEVQQEVLEGLGIKQNLLAKAIHDVQQELHRRNQPVQEG